jgi:hypothetical protein
LILKSSQQGAQSFLYAAMEGQFGQGENMGGWLIKECREVDLMRKEVRNLEVAKQLWEFSEQQIQAKEKESATRRALAKKTNDSQQETRSDPPTGQTGSSNTTAKAQTAGSRRNRKANK